MSEGMVFPREVFEKAIVSCGLHVAKAGLLWTAYLEFELAVMTSLQVHVKHACTCNIDSRYIFVRENFYQSLLFAYFFMNISPFHQDSKGHDCIH